MNWFDEVMVYFVQIVLVWVLRWVHAGTFVIDFCMIFNLLKLTIAFLLLNQFLFESSASMSKCL